MSNIPNDEITGKAIVWLEQFCRVLISETDETILRDEKLEEPHIIDINVDVEKELKDLGVDVEGFFTKLAEKYDIFPRDDSLQLQPKFQTETLKTFLTENMTTEILEAPVEATAAGESVEQTFELMDGSINFECFWQSELVSFQITEKSLENLLKEDTPNEILKNLELLKNSEFIRKYKFLSAVEEKIGQQQTDRYGEIILKYAKYRKAPPFIRISWTTDVSGGNAIYACIINPETKEIRAELLLGKELSGTEEFTSEELGFDPSRELWAIAPVLKEV